MSLFEDKIVHETDSGDKEIGQYVLIGIIVCCVFFLITMLSVIWRLYCSSYFDQTIDIPKVEEK